MILIVNAGSSSLKVALYHRYPRLELEVTATIDRLDGRGSSWIIHRSNGDESAADVPGLASHRDALLGLLAWMDEHNYCQWIQAVGHRVVHGGSVYSKPVAIDDGVVQDLHRLIPLDPEHLPQALACIAAVREWAPNLPQIACFDTAFHHSMPRVAKLLPLPRYLREHGTVRYGFHGLSYEYIQQELEMRDPRAREKRTIIAHLGNGASMVAVRDGQSIDTTMGMTPTGGLMMGTRIGDTDPGTLVYLMRTLNLDATALETLVNKESGLRGVSGISGDMRDILAASGNNEDARDAIDLFCYQAKKHLGALVAVLGGLDRLVFTGGIGEHAANVRSSICGRLEFLGIQIDAARNASHQSIISPDCGRVEVRVIPTDEDLMIARHAEQMLSTSMSARQS